MKEYKAGQVYITTNVVGHIHELKILAIVDNWIMCKFSRCVPFVKSIKEFPDYLERIDGHLKVKK